MTTRNLIVYGMALLASIACFTSCAQTKAVPPSGNAVCSIVNEDFCFAIDQEDEAALTIPIDFALYTVTLADKQKILIYYGTAPDYPADSVKPLLTRTSGSETITLYKQSADNSNTLDAFYAKKRDKFTMVVHIRSSYKASEKEGFAVFLNSFRKCDSARKDLIECKSEKIFPDIAKIL